MPEENNQEQEVAQEEVACEDKPVEDQAEDTGEDKQPEIPLAVSRVSITAVENGFIIHADSDHEQLKKVYVHGSWYNAQQRIVQIMQITDIFGQPGTMAEPDEKFFKKIST